MVLSYADVIRAEATTAAVWWRVAELLLSKLPTLSVSDCRRATALLTFCNRVKVINTLYDNVTLFCLHNRFLLYLFYAPVNIFSASCYLH